MSLLAARCPIVPAASAAECMAADRDMIESLSGDSLQKSLSRVFFWSSPAVSFSRSTRLAPSVVRQLAGAGIEAVVRPTGGAALLHGPGLDLSFSSGVARTRGGGRVDLVEEGRRLAGPVLQALRTLGHGASFRACDACGPAGESAREPLCFLQKTPFDILIGRKKVAAFALRRTAGALFLHGSLLVGLIPLHMVEALIGAGVGTAPQWNEAVKEIGQVELKPSRLAKAIADCTQV